MTHDVSIMKKTFALFGDPVEQSLSPVFQNAALKAAGMDGEYVALRVSEAELPAAVARVRKGELAGANVTIPHKMRALALADLVTAEAREVGAANWLGLDSRGRLVADNTDSAGFARAVAEAEIPVGGAGVMVVGAGGAARAAVVALLGQGAGHVHVGARRPAEARRLVEEIQRSFPSGNSGGDARFDRLVAQDLATEGYASIFSNILVSAVPPGAWPAIAPFFEDTGAEVLVDLAYARGGTPAETWAAKRGMKTLGGLPMLLHQGALSFEKWLGRPFPMEAARKALL